MRYSALQCVAVLLQLTVVEKCVLNCVCLSRRVLQCCACVCVAVCYSVLQRVAVCCSELQCVAERCSAFSSVAAYNN